MFAALAENPCLLALKALLPEFPGVGQVCLVGGAVRDCLLGKPAVDLDFTSAHDPTPLAQALARRERGHWFWLDESRRQSRVVTGALTCDFAPWRAATLAGDLAARDFTINAMAFDLSGDCAGAELIDPLGGRDDLARRVLRQAGPGVLAADPLRILKGVRHAAELGVTIETGTLRAMQASAAALARVAAERVRVEIWRILAAPRAQDGLTLLFASGAGATLFGTSSGNAPAEVVQRLSALDAYLAKLAESSPVFSRWLAEPVEQDLDRAGLLRWCHLLGGIDAGLAARLAAQWRFSRLATARIRAIMAIPARLPQELECLPNSPRAVALWALDYGPDPVDLLLALGLRLAGRDDRLSGLLPVLRRLAELPDPRQVQPLLDGHWLMDELGLAGAALGAALAELRRAEIRGEVANAAEARQFLLDRQRKNG